MDGRSSSSEIRHRKGRGERRKSAEKSKSEIQRKE